MTRTRTAEIPDPALRFFLRYAVHEGALFEEDDGVALCVLPASLHDALGLPEEVAVTADPDAAREDGAVLLVPGHPILDAAASAVLERGDAGHCFLEWPSGTLPSADRLLAAARQDVGVDHGRIEAAGHPVRAYLPVLVVGVLVTYTASLDERFQELDEVWVDGASGFALDEDRYRTLRTRPASSTPQPGIPILAPDFELAVRRAHDQVTRRAERRLAVLARESRLALREEFARADGYYDAVASSIASRARTADIERRQLLEGQAEVVEAERMRRRAEIEDNFRPRLEIAPFRVRLLAVPAMHVPLLVRRGERAHPFALTWLLGEGRFTNLPCPHCAAAAPLVAGRDRLGCRSCLATVPAVTAISEDPPSASVGSSTRPAEEGPPQVQAPPPHAEIAAVGPRTQKPVPRRVAPLARRSDPARVMREGNKLGVRFWETVLCGGRWPNKAIDATSPSKVLHRLYGQAGPCIGIGLTADDTPTRVSAVTAQPYRDLPEATTGMLETTQGLYPYTLRWRLQEGRPVLLEVLPYPDAVDASFPSDPLPIRVQRRLTVEAPAPRIELSGVEAALWDVLPRAGLPLIVRCLAAWWRVEDAFRGTEHAPVALAAALLGAIGGRARPRKKKEVATRIADDAQAEAVARDLEPVLKLSRARPW